MNLHDDETPTLKIECVCSIDDILYETVAKVLDARELSIYYILSFREVISFFFELSRQKYREYLISWISF
jgi:hypothetical protein